MKGFGEFVYGASSTTLYGRRGDPQRCIMGCRLTGLSPPFSIDSKQSLLKRKRGMVHCSNPKRRILGSTKVPGILANTSRGRHMDAHFESTINNFAGTNMGDD